MTTQYYYVERTYRGVFAIVEQNILEMVQQSSTDSEDVFIRPMHEKENWDKTIEHEQRGDKQYMVISDEEDVEDFLVC